MEWYYVLGIISYGIFIVQFILSNLGFGDTDIDIDLDGYGIITSLINKDGIIMLETEYGYNMAIKVLNLESKPSLYRGGLVY